MHKEWNITTSYDTKAKIKCVGYFMALLIFGANIKESIIIRNVEEGIEVRMLVSSWTEEK